MQMGSRLGWVWLSWVGKNCGRHSVGQWVLARWWSTFDKGITIEITLQLTMQQGQWWWVIEEECWLKGVRMGILCVFTVKYHLGLLLKKSIQ